MEPIVSSETSAIRTQTPGNYPKWNNLHLEHGESLRTRYLILVWNILIIVFIFDDLMSSKTITRPNFSPTYLYYGYRVPFPGVKLPGRQ